jgi:hypothetical protein
MKISDLLGEGWESDEQSDANTEPRAVEDSSTSPPAPWAPVPEPRDPELPPEPVSARAQLADLAAGLAIPAPAPPVETEAISAPDEFAGLSLVVDDLLPDATKRKGSSRGSSRSGSRRRGR